MSKELQETKHELTFSGTGPLWPTNVQLCLCGKDKKRGYNHCKGPQWKNWWSGSQLCLWLQELTLLSAWQADAKVINDHTASLLAACENAAVDRRDDSPALKVDWVLRIVQVWQESSVEEQQKVLPTRVETIAESDADFVAIRRQVEDVGVGRDHHHVVPEDGSSLERVQPTRVHAVEQLPVVVDNHDLALDGRDDQVAVRDGDLGEPLGIFVKGRVHNVLLVGCTRRSPESLGS